MQVQIMYNLTALERAAQFLWHHNSSISKWPDPPENVFALMKQMKKDTRKVVNQNVRLLKKERLQDGPVDQSDWTGMMGTGGYTILFSLEDDTDERILIGVDFLVDPAIGEESCFVTEELDFEPETV